MSKRRFALLILLGILCQCGIAYGASITNAEFSGTILATNISTSTENVSTVFSLDSQKLINNFNLNGDFSDVTIRDNSGNDIPFMSGYGGNPWAIFVPTIGSYTNQSYAIYLKGVTGGTSIYFPSSTGLTVSDDPTLELSDNGSVEITGWIDTSAGADKHLLEKQYALDVYVSPTVSGNITADIYTSDNLTPTGTNDPTAAWANDANAIDGNVTTYAYDTSPLGMSEYLELTLTDNISCTGAAFYTRKDANHTTVEVDLYDSSWHNIYSGVAHSSFTWYAIDTLPTVYHDVSKARFRQFADGGTNAELYEFQFMESVIGRSVSAIGISNEEHAVKVTNTANFPAWVTGSILSFDGTANSYVDCGAIYNAATKLWISFWFKFDTAYSSGSGYQRPLGKVLNAYNDCLLFYFEDTTGQLIFYKADGGILAFALASVQTSWDTNWHHVIGSISSVNGARLIIDGGTALTNADNSAVCNGGNFVIGQNQTPGGADGFIGKISSIIVGTDDLTPAPGEEAAIHDGSAPGDETDYWYADEGAGNYVYSYGSAANTGTKGAAASWITGTRLCDFYISIDGTNYGGTNLKGLSVPDNSEDWVFCQNDVMPYVESIEVTKGGSQSGYWEWEYGATFSDQSGNGNTATPSFRTISSDTNVSANLTSIQPINLSTSDAAPSSSWPELITTAPTQPPTAYTDQPRPGFFFEPLIHELLQVGNIPDTFFWTNFCFFIIIIAGMIAYRIHPSLTIQGTIMAALMIWFASGGLNVYGMFAVIYFVFAGAGLLLISRSYGI